MTVAELLTQRTQDVIFEDALTRLEALAINARGWHAEQAQRALVEINSTTLETYEANRVSIVEGGYIDAVGAWLDLVAAGWFHETRLQPLTAIVQLTLTDTASGGPYELPVGQIAVYGPTLEKPLYYRCGQTITVPKDGSKTAFFAAVARGAAYNVAAGSITQLQTPRPGVSVTSPAIPGTGAIVVSSGTDAELDDALRARCLAKWATLARGWMIGTIQYLIQTAFPTVTRTPLIRDPGDALGVVNAYCANAAGPITGTLALEIYNYLLDPARKPVGNRPVRVSPATLKSQALGIVLYSDGTNPDVSADTLARLAAYQAALPVGPATIFNSRLIDVIVDVPSGAVAATIDLVGDITPGATDVLVLTPTITSVVEV
jgi:hypothetical protein